MSTKNRRYFKKKRPSPSPLNSPPVKGGETRKGYFHRKIRVLLAKAGLDGHDRGIKVIAMALRDAGMEVIYLGLRHTPGEIVGAALEEDVDVIGVSLLSGAHTVLFPQILALLKEKGLKDALLIGGDIIPEEDIAGLKKKGVAQIFTPGATTEEIVRFIEGAMKKKA